LGVKSTLTVSVVASIGVKASLALALTALGGLIMNPITKMNEKVSVWKRLNVCTRLKVWIGVALLRSQGWQNFIPSREVLLNKVRYRSP